MPRLNEVTAGCISILDEGETKMAPATGADIGTLQISDDLVIVSTASAVSRIEGVNHLVQSFSSRGIKITRADDGLVVDVYIFVDYLTQIPQLAWEVQEVVIREISVLTGNEIKDVNIHVQGVCAPERNN